MSVKQALSASRLLTLTGTGGVGKTRLAIRASEEMLRAFDDGIWFVDLSPVHDPHLVAAAIAESLELQSRSQQWIPSSLSGALAGRNLLLVLDNCEHLAESCAAVVDSLLRSCPDLRVLVTSRQPLGIDGEHIALVEPLTVPSAAVLEFSQDLTRYDAVRLFVERAQAVAPSFRVTDENRAAVAELCRRLDGLPLALELSAARLRVLSPQQILDRLGKRLSILVSDSHVATSRQRSLRALIDWSYELCTPDERDLWAQLSIFPASFAVDAVEGVCSTSPETAGQTTLITIAGLVDKSIITVEQQGRDARYRMLETIRDYGQERLAERGGSDALAVRHREFFVAKTSDWNTTWFGPRQIDMFEWIRVERDNLRIALERCLAKEEDVQSAALLATCIAGQTIVHGLLGEGRMWMDRVLTTFSTETPETPRLLWVDGYLALHQGDLASAHQRFDAALKSARRIGDEHEAAVARIFLGVTETMRGERRARSETDDLDMARLRASSDHMTTALAAAFLGTTSALVQDLDTAVSLLDEAIALGDAHGDIWHKADALWLLSLVRLEQGNTSAAANLAAQSLRLHVSFDHAVGTAQCFEALAWTFGAQGEHHQAAHLLGAAEALWRATDAALFSHLVVRHDSCASAARASLGERDFIAAHEAGCGESTTKNVAFALGQDAPDEPSPTVTTSTDDLRLTRRELQIAVLVSEGCSNKTIANRLVISQRTAETHVQHILAKLSFTSRAQVAAWVKEEGIDLRDR